MAFKQYKGRFKTEYYPKKASTAMSQGALVLTDSADSGLLTVCSSTVPSSDTTTQHIVGVLDKTIATTDSDYASSTAMVPVLVPDSNDNEWIGDVIASATIIVPQKYYDLSTSLAVNPAGTTNKIVFCTKVIVANTATSVGKAIFKINTMASNRSIIQ